MTLTQKQNIENLKLAIASTETIVVLINKKIFEILLEFKFENKNTLCNLSEELDNLYNLKREELESIERNKFFLECEIESSK